MNKKKLEKIITILFRRHGVPLNDELLKKLLQESEELQKIEEQKRAIKAKKAKQQAEKSSGIANARQQIIRYVLGRLDFFVPKKPKSHEKTPAPVIKPSQSETHHR